MMPAACRHNSIHVLAQWGIVGSHCFLGSAGYKLLLRPYPVLGVRFAMRYCLLLLISSASLWAQCKVNTDESGAGKSRFQVELALNNGKLIAVREPDNVSTPAARTPQFKPSKDFPAAGLDDGAKADLVASLLNGLDPVLAKMDPLYRYFLTDAQKVLDQNGQFTTQTAKVRSLTANTSDMVTAFEAWIPTVNPGLDFGTTVEKQLQHLPNLGLDSQTPMFHTDFSPDSGAAVACFSVDDRVDPAVLASDPKAVDVQFLPKPQPRTTLLTRDDVVRYLVAAVHDSSGFWLQEPIRTHFQNAYTDIGLQPAIIVSTATKMPRSIHILESAKVRTILFPVSFATELQAATENDSRVTLLKKLNLEIEKIVYSVLPTEYFLNFTTSQVIWPPPPAEGKAVSLGPTLSIATVSGAASDSDLPDLDTLALGDKQANLQSLGYVLSVTQGSGNEAEVNPFVDYVITSQSPPPPDGSTPAPASSAPTRPDSVRALIPSTAPLQTANSAKPILPNVEPAVGLQYRPGQGVRVLAAARISRLHLLSSNSSISLQGGADTTHPVGTLTIDNDFLLFDALGRHRLSFTATANSDVTSKRLLAEQEVDQRTTGASAHTEFDFFREWHGYLLRATLDGLHESVSLDRSGSNQGLGETHVTTIDTGLLLGYASEASFFPRRFQLEPHFKYGLGLAAMAPAWHEFQILGSWHQRLSDSNILSLDVAGSMAATSRQTPIFLLPSLGGADTVRGFRQDATLGRKLWAVQTEFWAPVPTTVTPRDGDSVREFLRKNIRLAAFVDFGGIYDTSLPVFGGMAFPPLSAGLRAGPGVGLRFLQGPIALKLDWAYGLGGGPNGGGHGQFYIGVSKYGF